MTNAILVSLAVLTLVQTGQGVPGQQSSGVDWTLTSEEKARCTEGVRLARKINTLQVNQAGAREKKYLSLRDFALELPTGWEVSLDVTAGGYWFMATDKTHACGVAFVSNQSGIIFEARPLR